MFTTLFTAKSLSNPTRAGPCENSWISSGMRRLCGGMQSADQEHWRPPRTWWVPLEARWSGNTAQGRVTGMWDRAKTISRNAGMGRMRSFGCENNRCVLPSLPFSRSAAPFQSRIQLSHQLYICEQLYCHSYLLKVKPKSICWWGSYTLRITRETLGTFSSLLMFFSHHYWFSHLLM